MANKGDDFFFENFLEAAEYTCSAAEYLAQCLTNYDASKISQMLDEMHRIEHLADGKKHEMTMALAKAFITPFDREDLAQLSQNIDDVTDAVEEVLQRFFVNGVEAATEQSRVFAGMIVDCCRLMKQMLAELVHFKKPKALHELIVEISHAEEECDRFYLDTIMKVRKRHTSILDVIFWREIYEYMEKCADACEDVADSVEMIVMKNT